MAIVNLIEIINQLIKSKLKVNGKVCRPYKSFTKKN